MMVRYSSITTDGVEDMKRLLTCLLAALLCTALLATGVLAEMPEVELTELELTDVLEEYDSENLDEPVEELEEFTIGDDSVSDEGGLVDADAPIDDSLPVAAEPAETEGSTYVFTPGSDEFDESGDPKARMVTFGSPDDMALEQAVAAAGPCLDGTSNHVVVIDAGEDPTFQKEGLSEGAHCEVCGSVLIPQHIIPKVINLWMTLPNKGKYATTNLSRGDEVRVFADFATNAGYSVTSWKSSKPSIAEITSDGVIICHKEGKATITIKTSNKKIYAKVPLKINDPNKPTKVKIKQGKSTSICLKQSYRLLTELEPLSAHATLTWKSSKPSVATVDQNGLVVAQREGTTNITVKTHNGKKATIKVKVDGVVLNPNVHYRALLIGEAEFPGVGCTSMPSRKSVDMLSKVLKGVRGAQGNYWEVTTRINRTDYQIQNDIRSTFGKATANDVSLFFICTHGNDKTSYYGNGYYDAGCLTTYPDAYGYCALSLHRLASWLNEVPGKVVVLIDSCGSGAALYGAKGMDSFEPADFNQLVVDAFSGQDQGVLAPMDHNLGAFVLANKFYVMTASAYMETSWHLKKKYHYFVKWLTDAVKTKGKMPADSNKNSFLTLQEWYKAVAKKGTKQPKRYRQHIQVYPSNCGLELFYRKR